MLMCSLDNLSTRSNGQISNSYGDLDGVSHWEKITNAASDPSVPESGGEGEGIGGPDSSSISSGSSAYSPRSEILYNFDPYFLGANRDKT